MLSEYDFSTVSFVSRSQKCDICGQEFMEGHIDNEGQYNCQTCHDIRLAIDINDDDWLDRIIDEQEEKERNLRDYYWAMGEEKAEGYIATCQGCGAYGYLGLTCNRTEYCGEYI